MYQIRILTEFCLVLFFIAGIPLKLSVKKSPVEDNIDSKD